MDNAGDWLYIVLMIVAAATSLIGSKNKKKRQSKEILGQPGHEIVTPDDSPKEKGFWEVLEEARKEFNPEPKPQETPKVKQKTKEKKQGRQPFLTAENEIRKSAISTHPSLLSEGEETQGLEDIEFKNAADLRKAVIYSEILNRKY